MIWVKSADERWFKRSRVSSNSVGRNFIGYIRDHRTRIGRIRAVTHAVRVRIRLRREDRRVETVALANSGYEAETPQVLIPVPLAEQLGLWPPPKDSLRTTFETAGGSLTVWVVHNACMVSIRAEGIESAEVPMDIVISQLANEVLLSDRAITALGIVIEDAGNDL